MAGSGAVARYALVGLGLLVDLLLVMGVIRWIRRRCRKTPSQYPPLPGGPEGQFPTGEGT